MAKPLRALAWTSLAIVALLFCFHLAQKYQPSELRRVYRDKVLEAVPIGSTKEEFDRAARAGKLEGIMLSMDGVTIVYSFWEPVSLWKSDFSVCALPLLDSDERIIDYHISSCAHQPFSPAPFMVFGN